MISEKFLELMRETFNSCQKLTKNKGEDYTKGAEDVLAYFKESAKETNDDPKKVCYILMRKHWAAIGNYIRTNGKSQSEPIDGRIQDLINYLLFLQALIDEDKEEPTANQ
jgi:hypothetical protein